VQDWNNLEVLKVFELKPWHLQSSTGSTISLSLAFLGAAQAKVRSEAHFCFPESFRSLLVTYSYWHLALSVKHINCLSTFELNSYKVIIIFVIIKPLHPQLAHAFGYRLILSASVHSHTWPVIVTVMKRALLSRSLPVPRSTADENSNHNYFIIKEDSFTVQLTFSDGKYSSSIYLLAFHLCFVSKTLSFCLQIICIHVCWSYCFLWHLVTQS